MTNKLQRRIAVLAFVIFSYSAHAQDTLGSNGGADGCWSIVPGDRPPCMPKYTSAECLKRYPEDKVGSFCEWYGYSTHEDVERFEKKRGCVHRYPYDKDSPFEGDNDLWVCHAKR